MALVADFFVAFLPALFVALDWLEVFLAFLFLLALEAGADLLAFFTAFPTAFTGRVLLRLS